MNKKKRNAAIAELVLRAQCASDGGKGIKALVGSYKARTDNRAGYAVKDILIEEAVRLILSGESDYCFSVKDLENGMYLIYFQTKIHGKNVQVSFHSYGTNTWAKYCNRGKGCELWWDHGSSRSSAEYAYSYYCRGYYTAWA